MRHAYLWLLYNQCTSKLSVLISISEGGSTTVWSSEKDQTVSKQQP